MKHVDNYVLGRNMLRSYRTGHLKQQSTERDHLNDNRQSARKKECAFLFGDFQSDWATKLPHIKFYRRNSQSDANNQMGCRLYAVEVIYGEIEGFLVYLVPGYLPHGKTRSCFKLSPYRANLCHF